VQLICLGLGGKWSRPTRCCRVEQCPRLPEFTCLIEFLVSARMYTKFSERLSIKYPHDTEYPMPTGRSLDVERPEQRTVAFEAEITTMPEMNDAC
jgi:hypothetical protein